MNKVLDLSLKHKWYDMIERGEKLIEYREMSPYWVNRLTERKPEPERGDILLGIDQHDIPLVAKKFEAVRSIVGRVVNVLCFLRLRKLVLALVILIGVRQQTMTYLRLY